MDDGLGSRRLIPSNTVSGKRIELEFDARDSREPVARGKHVRDLIHLARFRERLKDVVLSEMFAV